MMKINWECACGIINKSKEVTPDEDGEYTDRCECGYTLYATKGKSFCLIYFTGFMNQLYMGFEGIIEELEEDQATHYKFNNFPYWFPYFEY